MRSSFELRLFGSTYARPQRVVVGVEERGDRRVEASLLFVTAGFERDIIHPWARVARQMASCLLAPQLIFARFRDETFLGEHHEERQAMMRRNGQQTVYNFVLSHIDIVRAYEHEVKGRSRARWLVKSTDQLLSRAARALFES